MSGTPEQVAIEISGVQVSWREGSLSITETLDQRSTCSFTVYDEPGTAHYVPGQTVTVTDNLNGLLFSGYVHDSQEKNSYPQVAMTHKVSCIDQHYLADKRVAQKDYANRYAGDIVADMLHSILSQEGINMSNVAQRSDQYQVDWNAGIPLYASAAQNATDVVNGGDLELAPSGTSASYAQQTSGDFGGGGSLMEWNSAQNGVTFTPTQSMMLTGTQGIAGLSNAYAYVKFWEGSYVVPTASPCLIYDIWIPDSCPQQMAGIDLVFSDGTTLRDTPIYPWQSGSGIEPDQQGIGAHPQNDLSGLATNQWYHRILPLTGTISLGGKTLIYATFAFEGDQTGNYTAYVRNCYIQYWTGSAYAVGLQLFATNATQTPLYPPQQLQTSGYSNMQLSVITTYEVFGYLSSAIFHPDSAGIYQTSLLSWQDTVPANCTDVVIFSMDGGNAFLPCTNNAPLPGLLPGQSLAGLTLQLQYQFHNTGNDPTQTPLLQSVQTVINPSYACTKSDVLDIYATQAEWETGTIVNGNLVAEPNSTLAQNGITRNWDDANYSSQTIFGTNGPGQWINRKTFEVRLNNAASNNYGCSRFDFAGQWANFTAEIDINLTTAGDSYGLVYRTTGWQNVNNTYAYSAAVTTTSISLSRGSNTSTGAGSFTSLASVALTLSSGNWHRLKVVINGSSHQVYLDDVLYINVTDSTYVAAGYLGAQIYSPTQNYDVGQFDNFGVCSALSGQWVSPAINLSSLGTITNAELLAEIDSAVNLTLCSLLMEISLNNGSTWTACPQVTNTAKPNELLVNAVPGLAAGTNVASMTQVLIRLTLATSSAVSQIDLIALDVLVVGPFSSSGSRISPPSPLQGIGTAGAAGISWNGLVPTNTSIAIDTSLDGVTWTQVASVVDSTPDNADMANITSQPDPTQDTFDSNTSANYTQGNFAGGAAATWTWDTANGRLQVSDASSPYGTLISNAPTSIQNAQIMTIMDEADNAGLILDYSSSGVNLYYLQVCDSAATGYQNQLFLLKRSGGSSASLASASISFSRGTAHQIQLEMNNGVLTVQFDGQTVISHTDASPLASGQMGFISGYLGEFYQLWMQPLGQTIVGSTPPATWQDSFGANTSADYTATCDLQSGSGVPATSWTWGTNTLTALGGTEALLLLNNWTAQSLNLYGTLTESDAGRLVWGLQDTGNYYDVVICDASSSYLPNTMQCFKTVAGVRSAIGPSMPISFTRGTSHEAHINVTGSVFIISLDNVQLASFSDTSLSGSGHVGMGNDGYSGHGTAIWTLFYASSADALNPPQAMTRVRMATSDPTATPMLTTLTLAAHAPVIGKGILIPQAKYSVQAQASTTVGASAPTGSVQPTVTTKSLASCFDDLAKQCNYWWHIDHNKNFVFSARSTTQAPRIITNNEMLAGSVTVENINTQYRNSEWITGGVDTMALSEEFVGDGKRRSFTLRYPIYRVTSIEVNGQAVSLGIKGIDTGKQFYYSQGSAHVAQDMGQFPLLKDQVLAINYQGQYLTTINQQSASAIAARKALDGTSGIVEAVENAPELVSAQAVQLANARLTEYAITTSKQITCTTMTAGLAKGQQATFFVEQHGISGLQCLITAVKTTYRTVTENNVAYLQPFYKVTAVSGPLLYDWTHFFLVAGK